MSFHRHRTLYLALLAALFVFVQAHALSHAAEHGDEPHDHYGAACELSVIATDQILLPAAPSEPFVLPPAPGATEPCISAANWTRPPGRAPPPRSPPSLQQ
ncbi:MULTISPECIES: hypothetical protein [Hyphomonas]|uniref:DUF2946 domain-containing protein n=1 Tax=Hyphomonas atlantica TaxID=1280948 RepID=A0A059DYA9_9PROT|nr:MULTISPECIES: hypothetical protein [Hyphomonas]KCZ59308.1 hypothetical protein HY36_08510 [Hyphomonas atlantica]MAM08791.1 hypothetical protein [Hyphomonas sp.]|tara:strand:- start:215 stop:517 length:303 start_codon:yes stop_codon:yes gene_type:complete